MDTNRNAPAAPLIRVAYRASLPAYRHAEAIAQPADAITDAPSWGLRRGDVVIVERVTEQLFPFPSRFASPQPDGSVSFTSWTSRPGDEIVEQLSRYTWNGRELRPA